MIDPDLLRGFALFGSIDDATRERVARTSADVHVHDGEYVAHEGEIAAFYVLLEGAFEVTKRLGDGERVLAMRDTPGDYFGEVPLLVGSATFAALRARGEARLMRIDALEFRYLVAYEPAFAAVVQRSALERIAGVQEATADLQVPVLVAGRSFDPACHDVRDFLARAHVPFDHFDIGDPALETCAPSLAAAVRDDGCAFVRLPDGRILVDPSKRELAAAVGLRTAPSLAEYDVAVVGGGPAGLGAAVYGASEGLATILLDADATGGQAGTSSRIENYLGFPNGISGDELTLRAFEQAHRFGAEIVVARGVAAIEPGDERHAVVLDDGERITARAVVLATGVAWRRLDAPGVDRLVGAGVYYGAARTEAMSARGSDVYLVGAGNSAGQAAMFFANYARTVTLLVRGDDLARTMSDYLIRQLAGRDNVRIETRSEVAAAHGSSRLEAIDVLNRATARTTQRETHGLFIFIGAEARTQWLPDAIRRDANGYVLTGFNLERTGGTSGAMSSGRPRFVLETSVDGIFAAGDVRAGSIKRCAAAVGEGSMAIALAHQYFEERARERAVA